MTQEAIQLWCEVIHNTPLVEKLLIVESGMEGKKIKRASG